MAPADGDDGSSPGTSALPKVARIFNSEETDSAKPKTGTRSRNTSARIALFTTTLFGRGAWRLQRLASGAVPHLSLTYSHPI